MNSATDARNKQQEKGAQQRAKSLKKLVAKRRRSKKKKADRPARFRKHGKKVKFDETQLGKWLILNAPIEFQILSSTVFRKQRRIRYARYVSNEVESIAYNSHNHAFRSAEFREALIEFRRYGLEPPEPARWTADEAVLAALNKKRIAINEYSVGI